MVSGPFQQRASTHTPSLHFSSATDRWQGSSKEVGSQMVENKTQLKAECKLPRLITFRVVRHALRVQQPPLKGADFWHELYHSQGICIPLQAPSAVLTRSLTPVMELSPRVVLTVTNYHIERLRFWGSQIGAPIRSKSHTPCIWS